MSAGTAHVVGAGLAGLAAAVAFAAAGRPVALWEAAPVAGGRCRSFLDPTLGVTIDNGNHLVLSGNRATRTYLSAIGAADALAGPPRPRFDMIDLADGRRWVVDLLRPEAGRLADLARLLLAGRGDTVADRLGASPRFAGLWRPLALAALNTAPDLASAALFRRVLLEALVRGARPLTAHAGLSAAFVDPALGRLRGQGARIAFGRRLTALGESGGRIDRLRFGEAEVALGAGDVVVLALPAWEAGALVPGLVVPTMHSAIVNAHFRARAPDDRPPLIGVVGGTAEWIFVRPGVVAVTVSAADRLLDEGAESLAARLWRDAACTLDLDAATVPPVRIVKEKRATFAATPDTAAQRPRARTRWANLSLAGDWTATDLPATIEGAIRSGNRAASVFA